MAHVSRSPDGEVLKVRSGSGCSIGMGLIFLAAGCGLLLFIEREPALYVAVAFLGGLGLLLTFYRRIAVLDRNRGRCFLQDTFLIPLKTRTYPLEDCTRVIISKTGTSDDPNWTIELDLTPKPFRLDIVAQYPDAVKLAKELSEFLNVPVADTEDGAELVRSPDRLDENLRDRLRRTGEIPRPRRAPENMRAKYQLEPGRFEFSIRPKPQPVFTWMGALGIAMPVSFFGLLYLLHRPLVHEILTSFFLLALILFFAVPVLLSLIASRSRVIRVLATPECIRVEDRQIFKTVTEIRVDEIEDAVVLDKPRLSRVVRVMTIGATRPKGAADTEGILVRGSNKSVRFGEGLPADELEWLHAMIVKTVVGYE